MTTSAKDILNRYSPSAAKSILDKYRSPETLSTPDKAEPTDLYGSDSLRYASSFGDFPGIANILKKKGYTDITQDSEGNIVAKDKSGVWKKDASTEFLKNPINYLEARAGKAFPLAGMAIGGTAGALSGGIPSAGVGAVPAAMSGGAVGAGLGESVRQALGKYYGTRSEFEPGELASETAAGAIGEGAGVAARPLTDILASQVGKLGKGAVSRTSSILTGVPREAIERLIERPSEVLGANAPGKTLQAAQKASQELEQGYGTLMGNVARAKENAAAAAAEPGKLLSTAPEKEFIESSLQRKGGFKGIEGAMSEAERADLAQLANEALSLDGVAERSVPELLALREQIKRKTTFDDRQIGRPSDAYVGTLNQLYGKITKKLHDVSPKMAEADAAFHQGVGKYELLKGLEKPGQMESTAANLFGKNKTLHRQAAEELIPDSMPYLQDIGANKAFNIQGPSGSDVGRRAIGGLAAGAGIGAHGLYQHSPTLMGLGVLTAAATSPGINKQVIGRTSQLYGSSFGQAIRQNPQLLETLTDIQAKKALDIINQSPWTLMGGPDEQNR